MTEVEELATELAQERTAHQQTIASLERLREYTKRVEADAARAERDAARLVGLLERLEWADHVDSEAGGVEVVIFERVPFAEAEQIEKECIRVERPRYNLRLA